MRLNLDIGESPQVPAKPAVGSCEKSGCAFAMPLYDSDRAEQPAEQDQAVLFAEGERQMRSAAEAPAPWGAVRVQWTDRQQMRMAMIDVEPLITEDHAARAIWELTGQVDLGAFDEGVRSREGQAGRPAIDVRLLASLWIYGQSRRDPLGTGVGAVVPNRSGISMAVRDGAGQLSHAVGFSGVPRGRAGKAVRASGGGVEPCRAGKAGAGDARRHAHPGLCQRQQFAAAGHGGAAHGSGAAATAGTGGGGGSRESAASGSSPAARGPGAGASRGGGAPGTGEDPVPSPGSIAGAREPDGSGSTGDETCGGR